ncbi:MAG: hypothetical protein A2W31_18220 [Planctomycetes bacterium RBG_16_64_10]|nr:MAG: hypothetical protein A2W31_18220 [Planctomycetes bacterium RBG_16_64_10]
MVRTVDVVAPSRLHFGMFSFGHRGGRQFGGVGVMIDRPQTHLRLRPADRLEVYGLRAERAYDFARRAARAWSLTAVPRCRIDVLSAPREHVGLGVGTQLGLAVAAGLGALLGRPALTAEGLARSTGRGVRSAVGTYGFVHGGMVVEAGKSDPARIGPLAGRVELPVDWRFVLLCPRGGSGLSGAVEARAFRQLPPVPTATAETLQRLAREHLLPAAAAGRFDEFSANLYRYGSLAGGCFAARQGGPFASPRLTQLVQWIRDAGIDGVGQSSWGPTLFALLPDERSAQQLIDRFRRRPGTDDLEFTVAAPNRAGARICVTSGERAGR